MRNRLIALSITGAALATLWPAPEARAATVCQDAGSGTGNGASAFSNSLACGDNAQAIVPNATVLGANATAGAGVNAGNGTAVGAAADASGFSAIALGATARATFDDSIAIGPGAATTAANLSEKLQFSGGVGWGLNEGTTGGRAGLRVGW